MGQNFTIDRSSQTHSHNIHFKDNRISQKVFRKEKLSSSRIHYCYIILTKECRKKTFVLSSSLRIPDPYILLKNPRPPLSPLQGSQTSYQPAQELTLSHVCCMFVYMHMCLCIYTYICIHKFTDRFNFIIILYNIYYIIILVLPHQF